MGGNRAKRDVRTRAGGTSQPPAAPRTPVARTTPPAKVPSIACGTTEVLALRSKARADTFEMRGLGVAVWPPGEVTYSLGRLSTQVASAALQRLVRDCFDQWERIGILRFRQIAAAATLRLDWVTGDHGDVFPFSSSTRTFGHAFGPGMADPPLLGQVHLNDGARWSTSSGGAGIDLMSIVLHELGHVLGIRSVADPRAVMSEDFSSPRVRRALTATDVQALRGLYQA
jgi:hypothetical protein